MADHAPGWFKAMIDKFSLESERTTYTKRNDMIVMVTDAHNEEAITARVYLWNPPTLGPLTTMTTSLAALEAIAGVKRLGTFQGVESPRYHSRQPQQASTTADSALGFTTDQLITVLTEHIEALKPAEKALPMEVYSFPAFSTENPGLSNDEVNSASPVWKWIKPTDLNYQTTGFWETTLSEALEHGNRRAGQDLTILVRMAPEQVLSILNAGHAKFTGYDSIVRIGGNFED